MQRSDTPIVGLDVEWPPEVINQGRGTHGVRSLVDEFRLPGLWSLHLYDYYAALEVDGQAYEVSPGLVSLVPPNRPIRYVYRGPSTHLYAHLRPGVGPTRHARSRPDAGQPSSDHYGGALHLIMSPGAELPVITDLMGSAVSAAAVSPTRTRADIWGVLLRLADRATFPSVSSPGRDHVRTAMSYIESRLPESLSVPQVAAATGISSGHLTRVFAAEVGETVVGYIRRRRVDHARRLLSSTTMSIGAIAASVGFPDLQAFNKACRTVTGRSPRQLRDGP